MPLNLNSLTVNSTAIQTAGLGPVISDNLILYLDTGYKHSYPNGGSTWYDLSGNGLNGTIDSGVDYTNRYPYNGDFNFDYGVGTDRITIGHNSLFNYSYTDWSYNIWLFYESAVSGMWKQLFVKGNGDGFRRPGIWFYADDPQKLHITWSYNDQIAIGKTDFSVPVGEWSNIVIQTRGGVMTSYLNGVQDTQSVALADRAVNSEPLYIGNISGNYTSPHMRMAVFMCYNNSLSDAQITQNYNALKTRFGK